MIKQESVKSRGRLFLLSQVLVISIILLIAYSSDPRSAEIFTKPSPQKSFSANAILMLNTRMKDDEFGRFKEKTLKSSWIKYFSHIKNMLERMNGDNTHITSGKESKLYVQITNWLSGNTLVADIATYFVNGYKKSYGGDFFLAQLKRPDVPGDGISCPVYDHDNGNYTVKCFLAWSGKAVLEVRLAYASEGIYEILRRYSSENEYGVYMNTTLHSAKYGTEYTECSLGFPGKRAHQLCDYSNRRNGENRMCLKPPSGECSEIIWQEKVVNRSAIATKGKYFQKGVNMNVYIRGTPSDIEIGKGQSSKTEHPEKYAYDPMRPSGWFYKSQWVSFLRRTTGSTDITSCFRNKRFYFIGDSTIRQWYAYFLQELHLTDYGPDNSIAWSQGRNAESHQMNLTFEYRAHGPPLHNPGPEDSRPYISNTLDSITVGGEGTIVFLTFGFHFELFGPEVFAKRVQIVKKSALSLLRRLPGIKIFIKGLHYHEPSAICPNSWMPYMFEVILQNEFNNIPNLTLINVWDITYIAGNVVLHPDKLLLQKILNLVLQQMC